MSYPQYGVYLIPPPHLLHPIAVLHQMLATEFDSRVAGAFMVHCTVKGFTKLRDGATPADFAPALDALFARTPAFTTQLVAVRSHNQPGKGTSLLTEMERTPAFSAFQVAVRGVIEEYIAPDCLFSPTDGNGPTFWPHITLTQYDTSADPVVAAQETALCQYVFDRSLRGPFPAQDIQLIEFTSDDWVGAWWESLRFRQLRGWRLLPPA